MPYEITTTIANQTIADTLVSAFEGGSNYWLGKVDPPFVAHSDYSTPEAYGENMVERTIYSDDDEDVGGDQGNHGKFNHENVQRGLKLMSELEWAKRHFKDMTSENGDADTGDVLLQLIVFGELIYG